MEKIIIIKYGELTTKKDNINYFINALRDNIKKSLKDIDNKIIYDHGRMFIETSDYENVLNILKKTFGIHEINIGYKLKTNSLEEINAELLNLLKDKEFKTFKVTTKRSDKSYPINSMEISKKVGGTILKNIPNIEVDVHNPNLEINIEIRKNEAYIYFEKIKGIGGYPVGTLGKGMLMLSGGIDSPVAGYLAMKRGIKLECIYFDSPPHTSKEALNKVKELASILSTYQNDIKLHIIHFTEIQEQIYKNCPKEYMITIMRRQMYRIAELLARRENCKCIINGESIGQVASQTLTSISTINEVITTPVIRPVCCLDKLEIIDIAKKIDTYETSILPYEDCCTIFVPEHPVINPERKLARTYEEAFDFRTLNLQSVKNKNTIKLPEEKSEFSNIL
ncbi:MAG: tRNA uracil 4-sulfurtransferase ThiI [bacterium]|nr:tRNA uracil 4-sulfurtransferase ThiI [bacterium]